MRAVSVQSVEVTVSRRTAPPAQESGLAALELVLMAIPVMAVVMLIVFGGRLVGVEGTLGGIAHYGARQAAAARSAEEAAAAGRLAAEENLAEAGLPCEAASVEVDTSGFGHGGTVAVRVTCEVGLADLGPLPLPGTRSMTSRSVAVVDIFRGTAE